MSRTSPPFEKTACVADSTERTLGIHLRRQRGRAILHPAPGRHPHPQRAPRCRRLRVFLVLAVAAIGAGAPVLAAQRSDPVRFLTGPNPGSPRDVAFDYLRKNASALGLTPGDVDVIVTDEYTSADSGVTHL